MPNIRPPVKWHGGKHYLAKRIIELFPPGYPEMTYVEPYGGAASVLLNKEPSKVDVYNDIEGEIVRLFRILRDDPTEFRECLALTPYAEQELEEAQTSTGLFSSEIEQARLFYVLCRQSMGGLGKAFAASNRSRGGIAGDVNAWLTSIDDNLPRVIERLRRVQIHCRHAPDVVRKYDAPSTLFYCDPPYVPSSRTVTKAYAHEMDESQHRELLAFLLEAQGKVSLSGYRNPMYDAHFSEWRRVEFDMPNNAGVGATKQRRTECVWMNYDAQPR